MRWLISGAGIPDVHQPFEGYRAMTGDLRNAEVCMILMGGLLHDGRVRKEAVSLKSQGYDVTILTMPRSPESELGLEGVVINETILKTRGLTIGVAGLIVKYVEFVLRAAAKAARTNATVYHAHDLPTLLPAYIAARLVGGRIVYDAHELFTEQGSPFSDNKFWRKLERWLLRRVDGILTTNESRATIIQNEYGARSRPVAIYNCPVARESLQDASTLRDFVRQAVPGDCKIVMFHGAISPGRQCEVLINAAKNLNSGTVVVFLGYGSPESYIDNLRDNVTQLGVDQKVLFHPPVPNEQIGDYISAADVGIVFYKNTCRNNYYCASNKLFDFLMAGVPILGSDLPGINEIVQGCDVGITIDSDSFTEIADAINRLTTDKESHNRMRRNAIRLSEHKYNWANQEKALFAFYRTIS